MGNRGHRRCDTKGVGVLSLYLLMLQGSDHMPNLCQGKEGCSFLWLVLPGLEHKFHDTEAFPTFISPAPKTTFSIHYKFVIWLKTRRNKGVIKEKVKRTHNTKITGWTTEPRPSDKAKGRRKKAATLDCMPMAVTSATIICWIFTTIQKQNGGEKSHPCKNKSYMFSEE